MSVGKEEEGSEMMGGGKRERRENVTIVVVVTMRSCTASRFESTWNNTKSINVDKNDITVTALW
jgi:hypothetical protein